MLTEYYSVLEMLGMRGCGSVVPLPTGCLLTVSKVYEPVKTGRNSNNEVVISSLYHNLYAY